MLIESNLSLHSVHGKQYLVESIKVLFIAPVKHYISLQEMQYQNNSLLQNYKTQQYLMAHLIQI